MNLFICLVIYLLAHLFWSLLAVLNKLFVTLLVDDPIKKMKKLTLVFLTFHIFLHFKVQQSGSSKRNPPKHFQKKMQHFAYVSYTKIMALEIQARFNSQLATKMINGRCKNKCRL